MREWITGFLLFICLFAAAQSDKVYLKNGSLIRGRVLAESGADTLAVRIRQNTIELPFAIVDEVRFSKASEVDLKRFPALTYRRGWSTVVEAGMVIGSHSPEEVPEVLPSFRLVQEYSYHPLLNVGAGAGFVSYRDYRVFPLTLDYHAMLGRKNRGWMLYGSVGYGLSRPKTDGELSVDVNGGLFYQAGLGWQQRVSNNYIRMKFGYAVQRLEERRELSPVWVRTLERQLNRITIQVAYVFSY